MRNLFLVLVSANMIAFLLAGCGGKSTPESSSESSWLTCETHTECMGYRQDLRCDAQGYCVDDVGNRARREVSDAQAGPLDQPPSDAQESSIVPTAKGPCTGAYLIEKKQDLDAIAGCKTITGSITITDTTLTAINLPELELVTEDFVVYYNSALLSLELAALTEVGGNLFVDHHDVLERLSLPLLDTVGEFSASYNLALTNLELPGLSAVQDFELTYNDRLESVSIPALANVAGLLVKFNDSLGALSAPELVRADSISVDVNASLVSANFPVLMTLSGEFGCYDNMMLTTLNLPELSSAGTSVDIDSNPKLTMLELSQLSTVGDVLDITSSAALVTLRIPALTMVSRLNVTANDVLTDLTFEKLTTAGQVVDVSFNDALEHVEFPLLRTVGAEFSVHTNALLPNCQVLSILDNLVSFEGTSKITGNSARDACP